MDFLKITQADYLFYFCLFSGKSYIPASTEYVAYIHTRLMICPHNEYPRKTSNPQIMMTLRMENLLHNTAATGPECRKKFSHFEGYPNKESNIKSNVLILLKILNFIKF